MESAMQERGEGFPKATFEIVRIEKETKMLEYFMKDGYWSSVFLSVYPELETLPPEAYGDFLQKQHELKEYDMLAMKEAFEAEWNRVGPEYLQTLSDYFETEWPADKQILGQISVLPVYPRSLDDYSFYVGYKNVQSMVETAAHEIQHFLWFKKWKEVFPDMDRREYDRPHLAWHLSEIMDPIILQCHPKIKQLIKPKQWGYSSFKDIRIGSETMTDHFKDLYESCLASEEPFEETLKKLWAEANKYQDEINQF